MMDSGNVIEKFSVQKIEGLGKVHFVGICGRGMAPLAICLSKLGVHVTGSDTSSTYGSTLRLLREAGIKVTEHFDEAHIAEADTIVVSRSFGRGNIEIEAVLSLHKPYYSLPEFLLEHFLRGSKNAVVAGTKGKTTTTAILTWILMQEKIDPGYLIGGLFNDAFPPAHLPGSGINVIEGDDYETLFWDHSPKFAYYRPDAIILTNIFQDHPEYHVDDEGAVKHFKSLISQLPKNGLLVTGSTGAMMDAVTSVAPCPKVSVGFEPVADFQISNWQQSGELSEFDFADAHFEVPLTGRFNALNVAQAALVANHYGVTIENCAKHMRTFKGVRGRQELIGTKNNISIYNDLAYLPECMELMSESFRLRHPGCRLILVYQARMVDAIPGKELEIIEMMRNFDLVLMIDAYKYNYVFAAPANANFTAQVIEGLNAKNVPALGIGPMNDFHMNIPPHLRPGDVVVLVTHPRYVDILPKLVEHL